VEEFAEKMRMILEKPELRRRLLENSQEFVQKIGWKRSNEKYLGLPDSLTEKTRFVEKIKGIW
jgi:hypothetical protein